MNTATKTQQIETVEAHCDICGNQETDDAETLKNEGWYLGRREHFCPTCND
jgi:hypothetical protein